MLVNSSSRPSIPKLDSVKQEGDNNDGYTNGNENSETLIGEVKVDLQVLTSQKVSDLINIALTYFDHQILCYILNTRKTQELFEDLRAHVDEIGYAEQIFCTYPNNTYISPELIYSLSVIGSIYRDDLPGALFYYELSQRIIFHNYTLSKSSYPKLVALVLNAFFELNRGELSSAWQLSGMSFRMGFDLGLHDSTKEEPDEAMNNLKNLTYWGTFIIDNYAGYIFGRPKMLMYDCDYPIFNNGLNDIKLPHIVGLLAMGDPMITSIYQIMPFKDAEEFKRTFIVKYNQLREYNNRLIQWRNALPKELVWNMSSLKRSARITDHSFKFAFYLMFIILNKPFLLLPIGSDISMFTVICQEMEIIFRNVEDPCYLKNIVVLYVMILVCKLMLIQLLNRNSKKIDEQFERLEFFISYIKVVFKADVWILAKYPLAMLESRVMVLKKELKQHEQVNSQSTPAITSTPSDANAVQVKITGTSISSSSSSGRSNSIVDPMIPYTDENMSQNVGFLKMVDALFSQGTITPTQGMFPVSTAGTPTAAQEQIDNSLHISNNGATGATVQGSSETFNNIFSFDLLDLDAYMQQ
ncbi:uncharacterized protein SPAPADRAFT_138844 [Spathaspora passalidarum NRRL Y-27907]|uniref:Xylanolytic transcriptional activator regulatory domain-containing protein n=1 Tax=Spathaspora passalidarum (strain NRRL Y-27907 / 11-Y1) TaxID=619300 RepID=G3ANM4_SPAPN|nr:uncharacterized protein SPAPADRAFT_138844 [Spathaspora passalidarum NRRL Y-27907]EGW32553.1 hypothetical protein SPAPADRAFT_138844 [Spathaspora passalidarum NRRL Y-27907]